MTTSTVENTTTLDIQGMTCSSCASRIERKLNKMEGVQASVNYATEKATVSFPPLLTVEDLINTVRVTGYDAQEHAETPIKTEESANDTSTRDAAAETLRNRLVISTVLTIPVLLLSMIPALQFTNWQWLALTLASPVVVWGAWPFHKAAVMNLRHGTLTMDTLISLGVSAAYLYSLYSLFLGTAGESGLKMSFSLLPMQSGETSIYLEVASSVTVLILLGRYLEQKAKRTAGAALRALLDLGAKEAIILREDGTQVTVPVGDLHVGSVFIVKPGERIATDGIVLSGSSAVDTSMMTGESLPADVEPDSRVTGGTVNTYGLLTVQATRVGSDTQLARMAALVEQAQSGKAPMQRLVDKVSMVFVPVIVAVSLITLLTWLILGYPASDAFTAAVSVLIIACPCALGLATPTAFLVGTGRGAQLGIIIRSPEILESTRSITSIVLDKTGTVTEGKLAVHAVESFAGDGTDLILKLAGALESASNHPIAKAITSEALTLHGSLPAVMNVVDTPGKGISGTIEGREALIGRAAYVAGSDTTDYSPIVSPYLGEGRTVVYIAWDGMMRGVVVLSDTVKPSSRQAITEFKRMGLTPVLLTGDNADAAEATAAEVGISEVIADVHPEDKARIVAELQGKGNVVAMVGDGVNDSIALATADLGISMGSGSDAAMEASDITLVNNDLAGAADAIRLSRATLRTIKGNLFWAFAYNTAAVPLAAFGLLNPIIAGAAMAFSSLFVLTNSLRLRRFKPAKR